MKKEYWFVMIVYIIAQLSSIVGVPILLVAFDMGIAQATAWWIFGSFAVAVLLTLLLLRKEMTEKKRDLQAPIGISLFWAIAGIFLAFFAQTASGMIEQAIGIDPGSENTQHITSLIEQAPMMIVATALFGPILEEIIFRKIIFGSLYKRFNFFLSALISSAIFGLAHFELEHLLLYTAMGLTFAFLYVRTKRIWVSIVAHVAMNSIVVLMQVVFKDEIEEMLEHAPAFIGGFL
ncbi:CPBP family intramembrane glutamic endopeptidase [Bacillus massiliglaciei]|uniref:CPBP family intramembrane glutamic endopeptidase n=1 Tax=Bacillus massiliglaciei TaxID=1816693 RepID=UPI000B20002E|nr:type II CAAX endopeptidase family protein [Bacillus massiliglaciei]